MQNRLTWRMPSDLDVLPQRIEHLPRTSSIMAGWHIPHYRRLAKRYANKCWRVMLMDNPWEGSIKQRLGSFIAPFYLRPAADVAWIPGERQATFARKMAFAQSAILWGSLSCDQPAFATAHHGRIGALQPVPRVFLFLGRFVRGKGLGTLVHAYQIYRNKHRIRGL